jgi:hypothetical protein
MCSRWYTPEFRIVTIDIQVFAPPWHQGLCPGVEASICLCIFRVKQSKEDGTTWERKSYDASNNRNYFPSDTLSHSEDSNLQIMRLTSLTNSEQDTGYPSHPRTWGLTLITQWTDTPPDTNKGQATPPQIPSTYKLLYTCATMRLRETGSRISTNTLNNIRKHQCRQPTISYKWTLPQDQARHQWW